MSLRWGQCTENRTGMIDFTVGRWIEKERRKSRKKWKRKGHDICQIKNLDT